MSTVVVGAVRSILMPPTVFVVSLPALSATVADAERSSPSPVIVASPGAAAARPERASEAVQCTVTSPLYQPAAFGSEVAAPLSDGAVLSMSMPATVSLAGVAGGVGRGARDGLVLDPRRASSAP